MQGENQLLWSCLSYEKNTNWACSVLYIQTGGRLTIVQHTYVKRARKECKLLFGKTNDRGSYAKASMQIAFNYNNVLLKS